MKIVKLSNIFDSNKVYNLALLSINCLYSLIQVALVGTALALHVVRVASLLVHDAHQLHPWIILGAMASHAATLPHGHLGGFVVALVGLLTVALAVTLTATVTVTVTVTAVAA